MNPEHKIKELFQLYRGGTLSLSDKTEVRLLINDYKQMKGSKKLPVYTEEHPHD